MDPRVVRTKLGPLYRDNLLVLVQLSQKLPLAVVAQITGLLVITYPDAPRRGCEYAGGWSGPYIDEVTEQLWWHHESNLGEFYYIEGEDGVRVYQ